MVPSGVVVEHYDEIGDLPHFNPELGVWHRYKLVGPSLSLKDSSFFSR
jgi:hypothetical protein